MLLLFTGGNLNIMNILVIGNGFDLAHGLPTHYDDFLNYVEEFYKFYNHGECIDKYNTYFTNFAKCDEYLEIKELMDNNLWLYHFNDLKRNKKLNGKQTWIDFEKEISNVVQDLDRLMKSCSSELNTIDSAALKIKYSSDLDFLLKKNHNLDLNKNFRYQIKFLVPLKENLEKDLNRFIRCMDIYFSSYLNTEIGNTQSLQFIKALRVDKVLSFNYTNTYEQLYYKKDIDYIHGKANFTHNLETCNLVLGIDEYLNDYEKNKDVEFIQFKKFYQRILKGTGCEYKDWLNEYKNTYNPIFDEFNLYFIGHSLDVTDKDILQELILFENAKSTIYYHNQEALGRMIRNLVKVIGEDELIRRTGGSNATIQFVEQPR